MTAAPSQTFGIISPEPLATQNIGTAVIHRMIGHVDQLSIGADTTALQQAFYGVAVVNRDAAAAAVALPDPASDFQQSWYYWTARGMPGDTGNRTQSWDFDIRTKRRLRSGYDLIFVVENLSNELPIAVQISFRNLWTIYN